MPRFKRHQALYLLAGLTLLYMLYSYISTGDGDMPLRKSTEEAISRVLKPPAANIPTTDPFPTTSSQDLRDGTTKFGAPLKDVDEAENLPAAESTSVAGRVMMPKPAAPQPNKPNYPLHADNSPASEAGGSTPEKTATAIAKAELDTILKKAPIIIFSKSYCPYSRAAKTLLLETYSISPPPHVVELDHLTTQLPTSDDRDASLPPLTLGKELQNILADLTGRKTVPNILVTARSIGGADDIALLDREGKLAAKIQELGGKRVTKVERKVSEGEGQQKEIKEMKQRVKRGRGM